MISFYINPATNDLEFDGQNSLKMIADDDELAQAARIKMTTNLKEWFLNPDDGFERFVVLGKNVEHDRVIDAIYAALLQIERIARVEDVKIEIDRKNRKAKVDYIFVKTSGETVEGSVTV